MSNTVRNSEDEEQCSRTPPTIPVYFEYSNGENSYKEKIGYFELFQINKVLNGELPVNTYYSEVCSVNVLRNPRSTPEDYYAPNGNIVKLFISLKTTEDIKIRTFKSRRAAIKDFLTHA